MSYSFYKVKLYQIFIYYFVILVSFALFIAELGDYDYERHMVENLKDIVLLPRVSLLSKQYH
jgi:hypothetical protein